MSAVVKEALNKLFRNTALNCQAQVDYDGSGNIGERGVDGAIKVLQDFRDYKKLDPVYRVYIDQELEKVRDLPEFRQTFISLLPIWKPAKFQVSVVK